jgi:hypothetical protein
MTSAFHPITTEQRTQFYVGSVPTPDIGERLTALNRGNVKNKNSPASRRVCYGSALPNKNHFVNG